MRVEVGSTNIPRNIKACLLECLMCNTRCGDVIPLSLHRIPFSPVTF